MNASELASNRNINHSTHLPKGAKRLRFDDSRVAANRSESGAELEILKRRSDNSRKRPSSGPRDPRDERRARSQGGSEGHLRGSRAPAKNEVGSEAFLDKEEASADAKALYERGRQLRKADCHCKRGCEWRYSDTPHGSHGFACKVHYERFLSLSEKCLSSDHKSRPNSGSYDH